MKTFVAVAAMLVVAGFCTITFAAIGTLAAGGDAIVVWTRERDTWGPAHRDLCIYGGIAATLGAGLLGFSAMRCRQDRPGS